MRRGGLLSKLLGDVSQALDQRFGWQRLPKPLGIVTLIGLRDRLRERNLYSTGGPADVPAGSPNAPPPVKDHLTARTIDGTYNDLGIPLMGSIGSRFGRNIPVEDTFPDPEPAIMEPSPRTVSVELLTREKFIPATTLNVLAGAWLQFEVHDWLSHGDPVKENPWQVAVADDDPWPDHPMQIPRRPGTRATTPRAACHRRTSRRTRTGGTPRRSTGKTRGSPRSSARARTARSGSTTTACCPRTSSRAWTCPGSPATSGSGSACCIPCSRWSTTRSATGCGPSTATGRTTSCTSTPGW